MSRSRLLTPQRNLQKESSGRPEFHHYPGGEISGVCVRALWGVWGSDVASLVALNAQFAVQVSTVPGGLRRLLGGYVTPHKGRGRGPPTL